MTFLSNLKFTPVVDIRPSAIDTNNFDRYADTLIPETPEPCAR